MWMVCVTNPTFISNSPRQQFYWNYGNSYLEAINYNKL